MESGKTLIFYYNFQRNLILILSIIFWLDIEPVFEFVNVNELTESREQIENKEERDPLATGILLKKTSD